MAKIVLGLASSHGPMLSTPPDKWGLRAIDDRVNPKHHFKEGVYDFATLAKLRIGENLSERITPQIWAENHARCRAGLERLARVFDEVAPDIAVIFGDDQMEMYTDANIPAFSVYWGEKIEHLPYDDDHLARMPPGIAIATPGHVPPSPQQYDGVPELGRHIIERLIADEFDIGAMRRIPVGRSGHASAPHAYGFVYRQIMRDRVIPNVPVVLNTFYPPNQPTAKRCFDFGRSVVAAIESWDSPARVALVASGGLTHFVIDEEIDGIILDAFATGAIERITALGEGVFQSGTSEVKNWLPVAGAMVELGYPMTLVDYVACYRSEAGTGNGMGFVYWKPE